MFPSSNPPPRRREPCPAPPPPPSFRYQSGPLPPPPPRRATSQPLSSIPHPTLYRPSIYSYTCRGGWFVSSQDQFSEGDCRGLKSRLELLADMDVSPRDVAIKNFTYMTDYELDEDDDPQQGGEGSAGGGGANGLNQKTKSILISPALIYKEKVESGTATTAPNSSGNRNRQSSTIEMPQAPHCSASSTLPEEELIKRQKWSCYGSTEVELLVLQNAATGEEHIAAVAPRNVGVSIRKIDADDGSITSIGIGWLNIVVDAGPAFLEDDDEEEADVRRADARQSNKQTQQDEARQPVPGSSEEVPPRPSQDSIARTRTQLKRYYEFAGKVGEQMKVNVSFLRENLQDDFVRRSAAAGNKIVANVPRTLERTAAFFHKMIDRWTGSGGGGDGGDAGGGGGRGPDL